MEGGKRQSNALGTKRVAVTTESPPAVSAAGDSSTRVHTQTVINRRQSYALLKTHLKVAHEPRGDVEHAPTQGHGETHGKR